MSEEQQSPSLEEQLAELTAFVADLDQRLAVWEELERMPWPLPSPTLTAWVNEWLIPTFELASPLRDWEKHPAITSELTALFAGYRAMTHPKASGWDALGWHGHKTSTLQRIEEFRARHQANKVVPWKPAAQPDPEET